MTKLTLDDLASLTNETSAIATINANNAAIETALENTLSRDGSTPNTMGSSLDMNSNRILNLSAPQTSTEPLRRADIAEISPTSVVVSSFMQTVMDDTSAATARATLGAAGVTGSTTQYGIPRWNDTSGTLIDNGLAPQTGNATQVSHASSNLREHISSLKITSAVSTRFAGAYRARSVGDINWYFVLAALGMAPQAFTQAERLAAINTCINKCVVGPRQDGVAYSQYALTRHASGKVYFCNVAGTTAGSQPSEAGVVNAGDTLVDNTLTWEYTGKTVPTSWDWFIVDIDTGLLLLKYPDSTDAYAGMLAYATAQAGPTDAWLNTASSFPSKTRFEVIAAVMSNSCTDELSGSSPGARLTRTFQGGVNGAGLDATAGSYADYYLADSCDAYIGYVALAALCTQLGDAAAATTATTNASDIKTGSAAQFSSGRFKTYVGQTGHTALTGNAAFVSNFRFHLWPSLRGMWTTLTEVQTYVDPVLAYTQAQTPGLFNASMDDFPLSEWYYAAANFSGWRGMLDVLEWRVTSRIAANVPIQDAALAVASASYGHQIANLYKMVGDVSSLGRSIIDATTAASIRALLGSTTVGDALVITASAAAARSTLGLAALGTSGATIPLLSTANTWTTKQTLGASTTSVASFNMPTGAAPTSPVDGDVWREDNTNTGLKIRINGVTKTVTVS